MNGSDGESSSLSTILKGGSLLFVGLVFELSISFIGKLVIARFLGPIDYGGLILGVTMMTFLTSIVLLGLHQGIGRNLPRYDDPEERRGVLVSGFRLGMISGVCVGALMIVGAPWIARNAFGDPSLTTIFRILGLTIPFANFMRLSIGSIQGMQHSIPRVYIENVGNPLTRVLGFAVVVALGFGAIGAAWAYLFSFAIPSLLGVYYLARHTPLFAREVNYVPKNRELLAFSLPLVFSAMMSSVYHNLDTLLLGYFFAAQEVGVYNIAYQLAKLLVMGLQAVGFIFMPVLSELHSDEAIGDMRRLYQIVTKWLFTGTLPLFLVIAFFPTMTTKITFGTAYLEGAPALSILAVAFFSHAVVGPNVQTLTSIGNTRFIMYITTVTAVLNLALNLVLIPEFSFVGAAVATTLSYLILNGLYSYQLYRLIGIQPLTSELMVPGAIGVALVGVIYWITRTFLTITIPLLVGLFTVFMILYGIAVIRFGIHDEEIWLVWELEEEYDVDLGPFKSVARIFMRLDE